LSYPVHKQNVRKQTDRQTDGGQTVGYPPRPVAGVMNFRFTPHG